VSRWAPHGLEVKVKLAFAYGMSTQSPEYYFVPGVAFAMIGSGFRSRAHRYRSIIGDKGSSVFPADVPQTLMLMNRAVSRKVVEALNPSVSFQVGDVARIPVWTVPGAEDIYSLLERAFSYDQCSTEPSVEFKRPGPTAWNYTQAWAQRAVDRPENHPIPTYEPERVPPATELLVSFGIGVALGRFGAKGESILDEAPASALPAGILFVSPEARDAL
jgi:hypothetical protein